MHPAGQALGRVPEVLFAVQLAATLFMTGVIWFVQTVHYPLFAEIRAEGVQSYAQRHATRTGYVVFAPMVLELATSLAALRPGFRLPGMSGTAAWLSAGLVGVLWASTGLLQVPLHERLGRGDRGTPDGMVVRQLVASNWVRTVAWTLRSGLLLAVLLRSRVSF